jgi:hypothetical protein
MGRKQRLPIPSPRWQSTKISRSPSSAPRRLQKRAAATVSRGIRGNQLANRGIVQSAVLDDAAQNDQTSHRIE